MNNEQPDTRQAMAEEAKRIEIDSLYSAKGHHCSAAIWSWMHYALGVPLTVLAAGTGVASVKDYPILAGILAFVVAALSAVITFVNPQSRSEKHHSAGCGYNALRNKARIFREIDCSINEIAPLQESLNSLDSRRSDLAASSPQISPKAYQKAKDGIKAGEADYGSVDLDRMNETKTST